MALSELAIKGLKAKTGPFKVFDENGLFMLVSPTGGKYWRFRYKHGGKEKCLALGVYPEIALKAARDKRDEARQQLREGKDPANLKRIEKLKSYINPDDTFESVSREWITQRKDKWSDSHAQNILHRLKTDVFPKFGSRPVREVTTMELLAMLKSIEARGAIDIAHRARSYCGQIFRYAIATGRAERDLAADLRGALRSVNPKSHARLEEKELPTFFRMLEKYDGDEQTRIALKLLIHTFVRTTELRGARWEEIDFEKRIWEIPAERMKMKEKHFVPLSDQVIALFRAQQRSTHNREHVFPNRNKPTQFISENTLLYAIYRMGYHSRATGHGFRATASTILNENGFNRDVIERQLAHAERNSVRAAYNYAQYIPERRKMMQWWSDHLDRLASN